MAAKALRGQRVALGLSCLVMSSALWVPRHPPSSQRRLGSPLRADQGFATLAEDALREQRVAEAKGALLSATAGLFMGFRAKREDRRDVTKAIEALVSAGGKTLDVGILDGKWELVYSDAPDILGIRGGPLSKLEFIGQDIDAMAGTIDNVIRYSPSDPVRTVLGNLVQGIAEDRIEQRVLLSYEQSPMDLSKVTMKVRGTSLSPQNTLGGRLNLRPLTLEGPPSVPFGNFEILYNDGDLRVIKTGRGNYGVNRRID